MEVNPVCTKIQEKHPTPYYRPKECATACPATAVKCRGCYVQPPRVESFAPKREFCPPAVAFEANSTYGSTFVNIDGSQYRRLAPLRPSENLHTANEKFHDDTTTRLTYQPVWNVVKAKPIIPRRRRNMFEGPMQTVTTVRQDFCEKFSEKTQPIVPCGSIRTASAPLEAKTTTSVAYSVPGPMQPAQNFKPVFKYCPPEERVSNETTAKLSYQPFEVPRRENYPWAEKPKYKRSNVSMDNATTYSNSFYGEHVAAREKPIVPVANKNLLHGDDDTFIGSTLYKEYFIPHQYERTEPIVPCENIALSKQKMSEDTTTKLSYPVVCGEKRSPIRPRQRSVLSAKGQILSNTTNREDFGPKAIEKPAAIIPCNNICHSKEPLDSSTMTQVAYMNPGKVAPPESFKPHLQYNMPTLKLDTDTVNKLSYKSWNLEPKMPLPWAKKGQYEPPKKRMEGNSTYHTSFAPPGYFIEECETIEENPSC